jgi:hypothetical protein
VREKDVGKKRREGGRTDSAGRKGVREGEREGGREGGGGTCRLMRQFMPWSRIFLHLTRIFSFSASSIWGKEDGREGKREGGRERGREVRGWIGKREGMRE